MKAILCEVYGAVDQLRLRDIAKPAPGPGSVRIRINVAALNPPDVLMAQGKYQVKPAVPFVLGVEGAGVIEEIGSGVHGFSCGDRVMTYAGQGCFAEQAVVPAGRVFPIPAGMSDLAASGFVLVYGTAYHALVTCGAVKTGQQVVVLGAAGGIGLSAIQIAKALGARVIAVASTAEKRQRCIANGADEVLGNETATLRDRIKSATGGRGADVILDVVGGEITEAALRAIKPNGRFVVAGYASGIIPAVKANLILLKQAWVIGASWRMFAEEQPAKAAACMKILCDLWTRRLLQPEVSETFPLAEAVDALKRLADGRIIGKAALLLAPSS